MDDDAHAILTHGAPKAPGEEGLRDVRVISAIIKTAQSGSSVEI